MMNCEDLKAQLNDFLDGDIRSADLQIVKQHIGECVDCRNAVANAEHLQAQLVAFGAATRLRPDAGFYDRAVARAARSGIRRQRNHWVMTGFGGAIAAGMMIWVVSGLFFSTPDSSLPTIPTVVMALETPRPLNLVFSSAAALAEASMTVTLPEGIEIVGFAGQREITWVTSLKEGRNLLPLTLIATSPVGGELLATLRHGDDDKSFRLRVSVI